jgi:hypothetical protein
VFTVLIKVLRIKVFEVVTLSSSSPEPPVLKEPTTFVLKSQVVLEEKLLNP